jgi:hypothetical protein
MPYHVKHNALFGKPESGRERTDSRQQRATNRELREDSRELRA